MLFSVCMFFSGRMRVLKHTISRLVFFAGVLCLGNLLPLGIGVAHSVGTVAVVISQRIRPYMEVLEGINEGLSGKGIDLSVHYLGDDVKSAAIQRELQRNRPALLVAVGPEAMSLSTSVDAPVMYSAVLSPPTDFSCGVSLNIPVYVQLGQIEKFFPAMKRVGILFDPAHNQGFYEEAQRVSAFMDVTIVPLRVSSTDVLSSVLRENWDKVDGLWMIPDPTIISASLVQYIIKQALFQKKAVLGYNHFFIQSGALFAFEFDYEALGKQTAEQILRHLFQEHCSRKAPVFHTRINTKIAQKLGIQWKEETP